MDLQLQRKKPPQLHSDVSRLMAKRKRMHYCKKKIQNELPSIVYKVEELPLSNVTFKVLYPNKIWFPSSKILQRIF